MQQGGLSWQSQYTMAQDLLSDSNTTNLTLIKTLVGQGQTSLEAQLNIDYTVKTRDFTTYTDAVTGSSYRAYALPEDLRRVVSLYVTVGTTRYVGEQIFNEELWQTMNTTTGNSNNCLQFFFIRGSNRVELYPIPSSACTATMIYQGRTKILSSDDYTGGSILTLANGSAAVTGSSTTFTAAMVGRYFKINADNYWYRVAAYGTATTITLDSEYQGTSIAAGSEAYTIGEFPITPPDTHILPVYYACWKYSLFRKNLQMSREYEKMWREGVINAQADYANSNASHIINNAGGFRGVVNPNYYPSGLT